MSDISPHFRLDWAPLADPAAVVSGPHVRFTVLTSQSIRIEYSPADIFEDRPSQVFWYRQQAVPPFEVKRQAGHVEITTAHLHLVYEGPGPFTPERLSITLLGTATTWRYGDPDRANLLGTARTLDGIAGHTELEPGLLSRAGWVVVDDSATLVFDTEGWLEARRLPANLDLYFFGYGQDYHQCLRDYSAVAGQVPLLPRWALGNWWSRYWDYTQDELLDLMEDFKAHDVPLSVCIVDMDWHLTETGNASSGWTGYTWNRALFPDPEAFITRLHGLGLKTALNLHPASGIYPHEETYPAMARFMGIDPASQVPVPFDIADPHFARGYLELLHHPLEAQGVDFWWMDWQQGTSTRLSGLDPLWWLNHLHFYDLGRDGTRRPFIFSRWGRLSNHRYPIGFSGDTIVNWESLAFQPYFTTTAANVAYGWWSHDIGGHMFGVEDGELYARWVQYGLFSPILRLHSTKNPYQDRRPWGYDAVISQAASGAMRLRHAFVPYLYSMAWRYAQTTTAVCNPMYHAHPLREEAYRCPNQYTFGSELIAAPFITPRDPDTRLSRQVIWLPEGDWFDFFSGEHYAGDAWHALYGGLEHIPVFARAGAIVPLGPKVGWGGIANPEALSVHVFPGADNRFELFEDDGETTAYQQGHYAITDFIQTWAADHLDFHIEPPQGDVSSLPARRAYTLIFHSLAQPGRIVASLNDSPISPEATYDVATRTLTVGRLMLGPTDRLAVTLQAEVKTLLAASDTTPQRCLALLEAFKAPTSVKYEIQRRLPEILADVRDLLPYKSSLTPTQLQALIEAITGAGLERIANIGHEEFVVLWNNREDPGCRYQLSVSNGDTWHHRYWAERGPVPRFKVIDQATLEVKPWSVQVDFFDVLSVETKR